MSAIVREEGKVVLERSNADQEVEVSDELPLCAQTATLFSEQPGSLFVDIDDSDILQNIKQSPFVLFGIS